MEAKQKVRKLKRIFDIVVSSSFLFVMSPFILAFLVLIKIEQIFRGRPFDPMFYRETRMSFGQKFTLIKFNIFKYELIEEARANGSFIHTKKLEHNGGLIKVGWLLKQIYMDEIPQFYCVLKGEMSLIGPRPYNLEVHEEAMKDGLSFRNNVPAGITGNYQSHKESVGVSSAELDKEYVDAYKSKSALGLLLFDLVIILRTLKVIVLARGI